MAAAAFNQYKQPREWGIFEMTNTANAWSAHQSKSLFENVAYPSLDRGRFIVQGSPAALIKNVMCLSRIALLGNLRLVLRSYCGAHFSVQFARGFPKGLARAAIRSMMAFNITGGEIHQTKGFPLQIDASGKFSTNARYAF